LPHFLVTMSQLSAQVKSYLKFYSSATTVYQAHSPSLYRFASNVVESRHASPPIFRDIEAIRKNHQQSSQPVDFRELGAGSQKGGSTTKTIGSIARSSLSGRRQCRQLARMVATYQPQTVLELGTSLGIATMYMAASGSNCRVYTCEGDPTVAHWASQSFDKLGLQNIQLHLGPFEQTLVPLLEKLQQVDMAFLDGNHSYAPTIQYFHTLLAYCTKDTLLVFDDIYWSEEMTAAWHYIREHEAVTQSIDLYHMGIVMVGGTASGTAPQHKLIEYKYKPWRIGVMG